MLYFRVKPNADQLCYGYKMGEFFVENELITPAELKNRIATAARVGLHINLDATVEAVKVNKNKTYWFFGARFPFNDIEPEVIA